MYKECIDRPVVERPRYEDDHCPVANAEVRNAWNYTSIPVAYRGGGVWGSSVPPPEITKALQNSAKLDPTVKNVKNC